MNRLPCFAGLVVSSCVSVGFGQIGRHQALVTANLSRNVWHGETVIGASSKRNANGLHELVVAFNSRNFSTGQPGYISQSVSMDSGKTWSTVEELGGGGNFFPCVPLDGYYSVDPMVAESAQTGDVWVGGLVRSPFGSTQYKSNCFVMRKPFGTATLGNFQTTISCNLTFQTSVPVDKCLMAIGPQGGGSSAEKLFVNWRWSEPVAPLCNSVLVSAQSTTAPLGQNFDAYLPMTDNSTGPCGAFGHGGLPGIGAMPVFIKSGANAGRIVVVFQPTVANLPNFMKLDAGETVWSSPGLINRAGTEFLESVGNNQVPGSFRAPSFPSIAVDPTNASKVYICFPAQVAGTNNVDIVIAQSLDAGATFNPAQTVRLTDAMLGELPSLPVTQFMPSICVDKFGKINLVFYRLVQDDIGPEDPLTDVYYARLNQFPPLSASDVYTSRLTPHSFQPHVDPIGVNPDLDAYLGDYVWITTAMCDVWAVYSSTQSGMYGVYVSRFRIDTACMADANVDSEINAGDIAAFANALASGSAAADVNLDDVLNVQDAADFLQAYAAGGSP